MQTKFEELITKIKRTYGIKYKDIANALGVSPYYLSKAMHGERKIPVHWATLLHKTYSPCKGKSEIETIISLSNDCLEIKPSAVNKDVFDIIVYLSKKSNQLSKNQIIELKEVLKLKG